MDEVPSYNKIMTENNQDELTKKAIDSLLKDAEVWQKRRDREFRATQQKQTTLNKVYLKNLLSNNENHNGRIQTKLDNRKMGRYRENHRKIPDRRKEGENGRDGSGRRSISRDGDASLETIVINDDDDSD